MTALNSMIHGGLKQLGISDDDDKRALYTRVTGQARLSLMTSDQQQAVADELRRLGYRKVATVATNASGRAGKPALDGKYLSKMQAMWIALYNLGEVKNRQDSALEKWAVDQAGVDAVRFIHTAESGRAVVEALKAWMARAGVRAAPKGCPDYALSDGYRIARAQWRILHPDYRDDYYLWPIITGLHDLADNCRHLSSGQWITVMNYLGKQVRALKATEAKKQARS